MENKFEVLFQPIQIGPVVAPNRFYQVPHCNGMGYRMPHALAEMRKVKPKEAGVLFAQRKLRSITHQTCLPILKGGCGMTVIFQLWR